MVLPTFSGKGAQIVDHPIFVVADDLSGATEVAAVIAPLGSSEILLDPTEPAGAAPALILDLNVRHRTPAQAAAAMRSALATHSADLVFIKVDSLLRGNLAAEIAAVRADGAPVVLATALPALGRSVRRGVVHLADEPLHRTAAWAAERTGPPASLAEAVTPLPVAILEAATVRAPDLAATLTAQLAAGRVPVCDAETDADLDAIVAAARTIPGVRLVGSGGLAAAVGRALHNGSSSRPPAPVSRALVVVGTLAPEAAEQVRRLESAGATRIRLPAAALLAGDPGTSRSIAAALAAGTAVLSLDGPILPDRSRRIVEALARTVAAAVRSAGPDVALVLTGGDTARQVLDALQIRRIRPIYQIHHGAVVAQSPDGRTVVTRPGSFGGADSLLRIIETIGPTKGIHSGQ